MEPQLCAVAGLILANEYRMWHREQSYKSAILQVVQHLMLTLHITTGKEEGSNQQFQQTVTLDIKHCKGELLSVVAQMALFALGLWPQTYFNP